MDAETKPEPVQVQETDHAGEVVVVVETGGWKALPPEPVLLTHRTLPPPLAENGVETSEGMAGDETPSSHAADVVTEVQVESRVSLVAARKKKKRTNQRRIKILFIQMDQNQLSADSGKKKKTS